MNVLALNDEPILGGAAQLFRRTNEILRRHGHQVVEVTGEQLARTGRPESARGVAATTRRGQWLARRLHRLRQLRSEITANIRQVYDPRLISSLARLLDQTPVEVAHVHNLHGHLSTHVFPFLKKRRIPIVYQVNDYFFFCNTYCAYNRRLDQPCKRCIHGNVFWAIRYGCVSNLGPNRLDRGFVQAVKRLALMLARPWRHVDLFLVTSDQAADLLEEWGIGRQRHQKLFNPILEEEFALPGRFGEEVMFYGTCLATKGIETFLAALEHVEPTCRIGVYLSGMTSEYETRLHVLAKRRGLRLHVDSTLRWDNGLRERVASARAVVVPSQWWVTSENVVYEAMALGKPVVVSRIGGNVELVDHGQTGFLFEPRNARELARYINLLSLDPAVASRMGVEARTRSRERFAESMFLQKLEAAYSRAIAMATSHA